MRIVFFGSPASALISLQELITAGHSIELVITQPDRPAGRGGHLAACPVSQFAARQNIPRLNPQKIRTDPLVLETLKKIKPDIQVVVAYGQIIPAEIISLPRFSSINVHFSLLPKFRGASPVQWAILKGEEKTGITIFRLNEKMDEGDILVQEEVEILPQEKALELEARLARKGADLLLRTLNSIGSLRPTPQDHNLATYAPKIHKEDGRLDWSKTAGEVDRLVRAFAPWPSAFTHFRGRRLQILEGKPLPEKGEASVPGQVVALSKAGLDIGCGGGTVFRIERLQPENRREMSAHAYSLGVRICKGDVLS